MKRKFIDYYMDVALRTAELSSARKLKVGAIIVKDNRIISIGYNGTPSGWSNDCEEWIDDTNPFSDYDRILKTKPEVIHAEQNALYKLSGSNECGKGASLFTTHSPCIECAKGIYATGITNVYYHYDYRSDAGIVMLNKCGIEVVKIVD